MVSALSPFRDPDTEIQVWYDDDESDASALRGVFSVDTSPFARYADRRDGPRTATVPRRIRDKIARAIGGRGIRTGARKTRRDVLKLLRSSGHTLVMELFSPPQRLQGTEATRLSGFPVAGPQDRV